MSSPKVLIPMLLLVLASCGSTPDNLPKEIPLMEKALNKVFYTCPEKIWPDVQTQYKSLQVIVNDTHTQRAWIWNDQSTSSNPSPKFLELNSDELSSLWFSPYIFSSFRGYTTLGISINSASFNENASIWETAGLKTLFHESFHFVAQRKSTWQNIIGNRNQPFPDQAETRYLRHELISSLLSVLLDEKDISAPAFWFDRYKTEFPEEFSRFRSADRSEGTAEYGNYLMLAIADLGCNASQKQLLQAIKQNFAPSYIPFNEPYETNSLASFILMANNLDIWKDSVDSGEVPLEILLKDIAPQNQEEDLELKEKIENDTSQINQELTTQIVPLFEKFDDPLNYIKVVLRSADIQGGFGSSGHYSPTERIEFDGIRLNASAVFGLNREIIVNNTDILTKEIFSSQDSPIWPQQTPCGMNYGWIITVPSSTVNYLDNGEVSIDSEGLTADHVPANIKNTPEGTWVCLEPTGS